MRKVVAYELLSLNGVAEAPDRFFTEWDDTMDENLARVIATQDTVLLGRGTYDEWSEFWPTSLIEPFASFINSVEKIVATSSAPTRTWHNSTIVTENFADVVSNLRQQSGGDIGIHGSITLFQSMFRSGLVDELKLVVSPAIVESGRKLFDDGMSTRLELKKCTGSPEGYLLLEYAVKS